MSEKTEAMMVERIAEIKAREGKATPWPWVANKYASGVNLGYKPDHERTWGYGCGNDFVCDLNDGEYHEYCSQDEQRANAEFIAAARQDIPDLLAEVERLRAENQRIGQAVNWLAGMLENYEGCPHKTRGEVFNSDAIPKIRRCKEWEAEDEPIECDEDGVKCWLEVAMKATGQGERHER